MNSIRRTHDTAVGWDDRAVSEALTVDAVRTPMGRYRLATLCVGVG